MEYQLALAQMTTVLGNVDANLEKHLAMIADAKKAGADVVIFPELSLTGYFLQDLALSVALNPRTDPLFDKLRQASTDIDVMAGFVEVDSRGRYYVAAAYLSKGEILHIHHKVYLPTYTIFDEKRFFTPGDKVRAFDTRFGRVGMLICEDIWHVSTPYLLWLDGADVFYFNAASPGHGLSASPRLPSDTQVESILTCYGGLFTSYVAYTNRTGYEDGLHFHGGSMVVNAGGNVTARAGAQEGLTLGVIDTADIRRKRFRLPLLRDERVDLLEAELERMRFDILDDDDLRA
jgi:NAD+ synthase (glutamine-hydrolysing)